MKKFDLRKYIFANITAFMGYVPIILEIDYNSHTHAPVLRDDLVSDAYFQGILIAICAQIVLFTFILTVIEIIVWKFLIEKKFPNLKINIKLNLPKYLNITLNVIYFILFYFGIFVSSLLAIGIILIMINA